MDEETWMDAGEAYAMGFVDRIIAEAPLQKTIAGSMDSKGFKNMPLEKIMALGILGGNPAEKPTKTNTLLNQSKQTFKMKIRDFFDDIRKEIREGFQLKSAATDNTAEATTTTQSSITENTPEAGIKAKLTEMQAALEEKETELARLKGESAASLQRPIADPQGRPQSVDAKVHIEEEFANVLGVAGLPLYRKLLSSEQ
jgi:hypothetical protein